MAGSLQDQLLKLGVVDTKKAKKAQHQKRKQTTQSRKAVKSGEKQSENTTKSQYQQAQQEKKQRDLALNKQRDQALNKKGLHAEVKELIQQNMIAIAKEAEVPYNFEYQGKIRKLYMDEAQRKQVLAGQLAIAVMGKHYKLVPDAIAEKIQARLPQRAIRYQTPAQEEVKADDPYSDYQVPDDLIW